MPYALIIHGAYGSPDENWIPWLKNSLEKNDYTVDVPRFPTPENQSLASWIGVMEEQEIKLTSDTIIIGHSIGPAFLMRLLEVGNSPISAAFFVSPFYAKLHNPDFDKINATFIDHPFNWSDIKTQADNFYVFHSDNDPYVPIAQARHIADQLDARFTLVSDGGHLNEKAGFTKFPILLEAIIEQKAKSLKPE